MGEYADMIIDEIIDWKRDSSGRRHAYYHNTHKPAPECKDCGKECCWIETGQGWRLGEDDGTLHECDEDERDAFLGDDFKPLTDEE